MTARIVDKGSAAGNNISATASLEQRKRIDKSYGAMTIIMGYLPQLEQLKLHGLDTWWYDIGVGRVQ